MSPVRTVSLSFACAMVVVVMCPAIGLELPSPLLEPPPAIGLTSTLAPTAVDDEPSTGPTGAIVIVPAWSDPDPDPELPPRPVNMEILSHKLRLDRAYFSPCIVDDDPYDPRYRSAVRAYQEEYGLQVDGIVGPVTSASLGRYSLLTKMFTVEQAHLDELVDLPEDWIGLSKIPRWGYESILEHVAERYHTTPGFLRRLNPGLDWEALTSGSTIVTPRILRPWPDFYAARVVVDAVERTIRVYDAEDRLRAFFNCSLGTNKKVYDGMSLRIANAAEWPSYTFRPHIFGQEDVIKTSLILPSGPNNLVGRAWIGLSRPGYGIHGTPEPERIGKTESHGCIRLPNWDAMAFYRMARIGIPVDFIGSSEPDAPTTGTLLRETDAPTTGTIVRSGLAVLDASPRHPLGDERVDE